MAKKRTRHRQSTSLVLARNATTKPRRKKWLTQRNATRLLKLGFLIADVILQMLSIWEKLKGLGK